MSGVAAAAAPSGAAAAGLCEQYFPEMMESANRLASEQPEVLFGGIGVSTAALLVTMPIPVDAANVGRIGVTNATVLPMVVPMQF
mgnify:CR=1 FL=1